MKLCQQCWLWEISRHCFGKYTVTGILVAVRALKALGSRAYAQAFKPYRLTIWTGPLWRFPARRRPETLGGDVPEGHGKPTMYSGFFKNRIGQKNLSRLWTLLPVQSRLRLCLHDDDLKWRRVFTFYFTFSRGKLRAYGDAKVGGIRLGTHAGRLDGAVMHCHTMPPISTHVRGIFLLPPIYTTKTKTQPL